MQTGNQIWQPIATIQSMRCRLLVAFANTEAGGSILIGVKETTGRNGKQIGVPIGIAVSDNAKLIIVNRALSCVPPLKVKIIVENINSKPFFRVDISGGAQKPYSTDGGVYKIREDARKKPLHQDALLHFFLEREAKNFRQRFSDATSSIERKLSNTLQQITQLEESITDKIDEMSWEIGLADGRTEDAVSTIDVVESLVASLTNETKNQNQRLRSRISAVDAKDPIKTDVEKAFLETLLQSLAEKQQKEPHFKKLLGKAKDMEWHGKVSEELSRDDIKRLARVVFN